jgi:hypothetical protein
MKKLVLMAVVALGCISASAQGTLTLNTYKGTDISKYAGRTMNVSVNRYIFNGWNTLSLPFSMTENDVNEAFGNDCKLEKLVGVENDGQNVKLNFQNCKSEGIKANTPYILHYTGETGTVQFSAENVLIADGSSTVTFTAEGTGETVTMGAAKQQRAAQGLYGILAKDNAEAAFVNVDATTSGFYATRCYVQLSGGNSTLLSTNHLTGTEEGTTSLSSLVAPGEPVDVFNLSGVKVASKITIADINKLQKGAYVVKGKTVMVQ